MSSLIFTNKTCITLLLSVNNQAYKIVPSQTQQISTAESAVQFTVCPDSLNSIRYFLKSAGLISKRHFVVESEYSAFVNGEMQIDLYTQTKKGKFMSEYEFCVPYCTNGNLSLGKFTVKDEEKFKNELYKCTERSKRAVLLFDILDIFGNALMGVLLLVIPFLLIWFFGNIQLAWDICSIAFIPIFIIIVLINRLFDKFKKLAWIKGKSFILKNQTFKNTDSYFEHEFIMSAFNNGK